MRYRLTIVALLLSALAACQSAGDEDPLKPGQLPAPPDVAAREARPRRVKLLRETSGTANR